MMDTRMPGLPSLATRAQPLATSNALTIWDINTDPYDAECPDGIVNLGVAENHLSTAALTSRITSCSPPPPDALLYGAGPRGSTRLRKGLASFLTDHLHPRTQIEAEHVTVTNGVSSAIEHLAFTLSDQGDVWLLGRPFYSGLPGDMMVRAGAKVEYVSFGGVDPLSPECVESYNDTIERLKSVGQKVKGIIVCNPHNPLGRCYELEALIALLQMSQRHSLHLISDEIYALSVWKNEVDQQDHPSPAFRSILSFDLAEYIDPSLVHILWGMSKDFCANGIRVGCIVSQANVALRKALVGPCMMSYVSGAADHFVCEILEDKEWCDNFLAANNRMVAEAHRLTVQWLRRQRIPYVEGANAGFFLWIDLGKTWLERHPEGGGSKGLTQEIMNACLGEKVFLASGLAYGAEKEGWFRLTFSHPKEYLAEGFRRIEKALGTGA